MAILKFGIDKEHVSSKIGGHVFQSSRFGPTIRTTPATRQWRTAFQWHRQFIMMLCARHWKSLTISQRQLWQNWANVFPQPQLLNDTLFINGYNLFCKRNFYRYMFMQEAFTFMSEPVFMWYPEDTVTTAVKVSETALTLDLSFLNHDGNLDCLVFLSNQQSPGVKYGDTRWRFVAGVQNVNQTVDITSMYLEYFGILPPVDSLLFVSVIFCGKNNGQFTFHELADVIVQPAAPPIYPVEYGMHYNWFAVVDSRNICPAGWHIPSSGEWSTLQAFVGGVATSGGNLKETSLVHWNTPNTGATNNFLFNARGSGTRSQSDGGWLGLKNNSYLWSATGSGTLYAYRIWLASNLASSQIALGTRKTGMSVRPIKDSTTLTNGQSGSMLGNDGKSYRTICIGTQEWVADNYCETEYRNGNPIPLILVNADWVPLTTGARGYYANNPANVPIV